PQGCAHDTCLPATSVRRADAGGAAGDSRQDAALRVISEMSARLLPSTVPNVEIHTSTYDVGDALLMVIVFGPGFIGVGGVSSVVSCSDDGVALRADRICI